MAGNVVFVIPNKLGGSLTIVRSILANRPDGAPASHLRLTDNESDVEPRAGLGADADTEATFAYALPPENLHAVLRRLRRALPSGPGVLVSNDLIELAMEHACPSGRAVVQLLHGDDPYYYDLAARHEAVIDAFVAYSRAMDAGLRARLPHRSNDIVYLPYGVALPAGCRTRHDGPLRLVFAGRIEPAQKGVFDLPSIDRELVRLGVPVTWTIIGAGPHEGELRERWRGDRPVTWVGALSHAATLERLPAFDVFVLPTRAEGFPVALVEAMGAGLVPIVSDIASGIPELVDEATGFRPTVGDAAAFAGAIASLAADPALLDRMSHAARASVAGRFDPRQRAEAYYELFDRLAAAPRPVRPPSPVPYGSRLDRPWIPNVLVRGVRAWRGGP